MSFVFLINCLSIFIAISFFPELLIISKADLNEEERFNMKFIILCSGLTILVATIGRLVWGENSIFEFLISGSTALVLSIWFVIFLCGYNYCVKKFKWKRDIKQEKKDYFTFA